MCRDSDGWVRPTAGAARVNEPCSTTAARSCSRRASIRRAYTTLANWHLMYSSESCVITDVTSLDRQSAMLLASLGSATTAPPDLAQLRAPWPADDPALLRPRPLPDVADLLVPGDPPVPIRVYTVDPDVRSPALVWLHPGGFVAGGIADIDGVCRTLAADSRCTVVSVGYRLAPEHPFPAALDDVCTVVSWLVAHSATLGIAAGRLAVGGQSAGGNLAAATALRLKEEGVNAPTLRIEGLTLGGR